MSKPPRKSTNLSAYKSGGGGGSRVLSPANINPQTPEGQKTTGRPKKKAEEKRSAKIALSMTPTEREKIRDKAGLVPEATYLMDVLKKAGVFD